MDGIGTVLTLLSGVAWTVVYAEAIRIGFTQRTYAIPVTALMLNIAWEWLYAFLDLTVAPGVQGYVNLVWGLADVAIVVTFFRFGFAEFSDLIGRSAFVTGGAGLLGISVAVQLLFLGEFGRSNGEVYSAFLQNLLMSGLFIAMFLARRGARGQSLVIAVAKWLGTLAPTIQFGLISGRGFVLGVGLLCSVLDLAYIGLLLRVRRRSVIKPGRPRGYGRVLEVPRAGRWRARPGATGGGRRPGRVRSGRLGLLQRAGSALRPSRRSDLGVARAAAHAEGGCR